MRQQITVAEAFKYLGIGNGIKGGLPYWNGVTLSVSGSNVTATSDLEFDTTFDETVLAQVQRIVNKELTPEETSRIITSLNTIQERARRVRYETESDPIAIKTIAGAINPQTGQAYTQSDLITARSQIQTDIPDVTEIEIV
jgi:hypothetical protein